MAPFDISYKTYYWPAIVTYSSIVYHFRGFYVK